MRYLFILLLGFLSVTAVAQKLDSHGIVIGAGKGVITSRLSENYGGIAIDKHNSSIDGKASFDLGYRFRFDTSAKRFFFDTDILLGYAKTDYHVNLAPSGDTSYFGGRGDRSHLYIGLAGVYNIHLLKGLSFGLGFQPTLYVWEDTKFDIPAIGKLSYNFGCAELAFSYKQGLVKYRDIAAFKNCRLSNWEFSLYIPLCRKNK